TVFLSLRKSAHDWQRLSGGRISRRRFFLARFFLPLGADTAAALAGASAVISDVSGTAGAAAASRGGSVGFSSGLASTPASTFSCSSCSCSLGSGRTPAASCCCLVQVQVPSQFSVLQAICRSSRSPISLAQTSQYC